jgi:hypothetical protein
MVPELYAPDRHSAVRPLRIAKDKKPKPIREESFSSKLVLQKNDFRHIDKIVDPNREKEQGRSKGISSQFNIRGSSLDVLEEHEQCP